MLHSPCNKCRLPSSTAALIISGSWLIDQVAITFESPDLAASGPASQVVPPGSTAGEQQNRPVGFSTSRCVVRTSCSPPPRPTHRGPRVLSRLRRHLPVEPDQAQPRDHHVSGGRTALFWTANPRLSLRCCCLSEEERRCVRPQQKPAFPRGAAVLPTHLSPAGTRSTARTRTASSSRPTSSPSRST